MFVDARTLPDGTRIEADIAVVGGGAAGITLALSLAARGVRVALLESGGAEFDAEIQALYVGENIGWDYPLDAMRLRYLGGTTNHWEGNCRPLDPIDFEVRPGVPHSGWPFAREDLVPYYRMAEATCETGPFDYDAGTWRGEPDDPALPFADDRIVTGLYRHSPPTRFGEVYRGALAAAATLTVYLHANLTEIETDDEARFVRGLRIATLAGSTFKVAAQATVLAAGAIENARLLLLSNRVRPNGLGNDHDLVGRFFAEHVIVVTGTLVMADAVPGSGCYDPDRQAYGVLLLAADVARREGLVNMTSVLEHIAAPPTEGVAAARSLYDTLSGGSLPDDLAGDAWAVISDLDDVVAATYRKIAGLKGPSAFNLHTRIEPIPDPLNRVDLGTATDRLGQRQVRLNWRYTPDVMHAVRRFHEVLGEEAGRLGLGRVQSRIAGDPPAFPSLWAPSGHHLGTARMHDDPRQGVVDRDGRVHGIANLYVAGGAVFPTYGCSNPTLTIVALAHRLADHVRGRLGA